MIACDSRYERPFRLVGQRDGELALPVIVLGEFRFGIGARDDAINMKPG